MARKSVSTSSTPRAMALRAALAMVAGASLKPSTWLAIRVSTEPTIRAVTWVFCGASSARRQAHMARPANLEGL